MNKKIKSRYPSFWDATIDCDSVKAFSSDTAEQAKFIAEETVPYIEAMLEFSKKNKFKLSGKIIINGMLLPNGPMVTEFLRWKQQ